MPHVERFEQTCGVVLPTPGIGATRLARAVAMGVARLLTEPVAAKAANKRRHRGQ